MSSTPSTADDTAIPAVVIGTACWLIAVIVLTVAQPLAPPGEGVWWWGVSAFGLLSGVLGLAFLTWRRKRMQRR